MGSQQSIQAQKAQKAQTQFLQNAELFLVFKRILLAIVVDIDYEPFRTFKITLANGDVVPLTWEILEKKFPGCTYVNDNFEKRMHTHTLFRSDYTTNYIGYMQGRSKTFWDHNIKAVEAFYNGAF